MILEITILGESIWTILLIIGGIVGAGILYYLITEKWMQNKPDGPSVAPASGASLQLKLAAYERLVLLTERIALPNVISRLNLAAASKQAVQLAINQAIRDEYEYNISQQIYVSSRVWQALSTLKDQNILICNQVAATLPEESSGLDLSKAILHFVNNSDIGGIQQKVAEALNLEAKSLMKTA